MTEHDHFEQLTPLDLAMPNTYIRVLLAFPGPEADSTLITLHTLQNGLEQLSKQVPWLSGRIFRTADVSGRPTLEIRSHTGDTPTLEDKGTIAASYATLSAQNMPPEAIPGYVWPVLAMLSEDMEHGIPVFAASVFRFIDRGIGLCICLHHHTVDATGFTEVIRLWAQATSTATTTTGDALPPNLPQSTRQTQLSHALTPAIQALSSSQSTNPNALLPLHPEFSTTPPSLPGDFKPCTSKLFTLSLHHLRTLRTLCQKYTSQTLTINTLLTALLWTTITRVRAHRTPRLITQNSNSTLTTAVNGRNRLPNLAPGYLGNLVLYATARYPAPALATADMDPVRRLAGICDCITQSQAAGQIGERFIAELCCLVGEMDYRGLYPGWDIFGGRDVTVTSWAGTGIYEVGFGGGLGGVGFVRMPIVEGADGVVVVLPRRWSKGQEMVEEAKEESVEVVVMLREEDMRALEGDEMWGVVCGL
ncbi:uncharacterized protein BO66DRAFT_461333 [Aspergillus aculeatinus CBS 121060]|uniref:Uncharacterized protein n=1 Tax=Aspergillus aculeatinus CBS 121060 TaxID=1448322 RepID=A0ACD1GWF4_9EURO|nr:hypothetical protein BO66DRAFT_461333 [Aspergillus aculeatinus CBS 121060]RAH65669.1 hypothetical protein BO66DRAFT_461333 [Aspergillus aculeatinus CBS 121060]